MKRPVPADRLRSIQAITDAELSRLDDEDLLAELLDRVRIVLTADTAAVLLLDASGCHLVATAASGLEEEVRQGVRIPLGRGFAGQIAANRQPVIVDHVDAATVVNPTLLAKGVQSMIGVPMIAGARVIGVMHVGSLSGRRFTPDDAELLQLAADRAALAVQTMASRADRVAAAALQRSLLPSALPPVEGADMAARLAQRQGAVGGDWYDAFVLPSGELGIVIGDVAGSGLRAAVIMGRMRSSLRSYALETSDPAEVLGRLDRKMQHFEPTALATVQYAVISPSLDHMTISSAGHLPPVLALPGSSPELAPVAPDLMIGVALGPRRAAVLAIPPGTLACFYTDGLVERRGRTLDDGFARLRKALAARHDAEGACATVMAELVGDEAARDDIGMLVFRRVSPAEAARSGPAWTAPDGQRMPT